MHDKTIFCSLTKLESAFELFKKVTINLQLRNLVLNATCSLNNALRDHSSKRSLPLVFLNLHLYTKVATFSAPTGWKFYNFQLYWDQNNTPAVTSWRLLTGQLIFQDREKDYEKSNQICMWEVRARGSFLCYWQQSGKQHFPKSRVDEWGRKSWPSAIRFNKAKSVYEKQPLLFLLP